MQPHNILNLFVVEFSSKQPVSVEIQIKMLYDCVKEYFKHTYINGKKHLAPTAIFVGQVNSTKPSISIFRKIMRSGSPKITKTQQCSGNKPG